MINNSIRRAIALCICILAGLTQMYSQDHCIYVMDFESPENKISYNGTEVVKNYLSSKGIPLIHHDADFGIGIDSTQLHRYSLSARFTESNLMWAYGYIIVEVTDQNQRAVWTYADIIKGRSKFGLSKRGSAKSKEVLKSLLDEFIVDYKLQLEKGFTTRIIRSYGSRRGRIEPLKDDSLNTFGRRRGEGNLITASMHRAIVEDSLYLYEGNWIPIEDVPADVLESKENKTNNYQAESTHWTVKSLDEYYANQATQPIESRYNRVDSPEEKIAIVKQDDNYQVITLHSNRYGWKAGSLKGSFSHYQVLKPFDINWITTNGKLLKATATINNSGLLSIEFDGNEIETYRRSSE